MLKNNSLRFLLTVFLSVVATGINYLITLLLTRYITETLGVEAQGFVTLAKTISGYALILTTALNSFAARFISVEWHKGEYEKANRFFNSIFFANIVLSLLILFVSVGAILVLEYIINIPPELVTDVKILFLLDVIAFCISSCSTVFLCPCVVKNRLDLSNILKIGSLVFEALFLLLSFKLLKPNIFYVGIGLIVSSLFIVVSNAIATKVLMPELKINARLVSAQTIKEVAFPGLWNSINMLGNTLNTGLDLLVCNLMLSALKTGLLSVIKSVSTIFSSLFHLVAIPFQPIQLRYYSNNDKDKLIESFKYGIKLNGCLSNLLFAGFFVFGTAYFKLWVPSQPSDFLQSICIVTIIGSVVEGAVYPLYYVYTLTLKNRIPCLVTIASGLLNVLGMFILIKFFNADVYGVVLTTTVLTWIVNFIFNPIYSASCLKIKKATFYPCLVRHLISSVLMTGVFYLLSLAFYPSNWIELIVVALYCSLIGIIIHFAIVLSKNDWNMVLSRIHLIPNKKQ